MDHPTPPLTSLRIAANRRKALKSTGPRTPAGKRRVALNARNRDLCPEELVAGQEGAKTKDESTTETQRHKEDKREGRADKAKQTQVA